MDDSTLQHNDPGILWRHYQKVVGELEASTDIAFAAVGLKYDLTAIQSRVAIAVAEDLETAALPFVAGLLAG